ncbi:MAG TPA: GyrI-like domain-containing protein, partial [Pirellulales bacterium]|nr:GyrI-like domain-containing protein [Pirellulales bacterium]
TEEKTSDLTQAEGVKMEIEIVEQTMRFRLNGVGGVVENERYAEVGMRLMNEMWQVVKEAKISTMGINHWVYLPGDRMFVGVELRNPQEFPIPSRLEPLEFELRRFARHLHVGPYQTLPQKWKELKAELAVRGETISLPSLEIYGHHCEGPAEPETTILLGLKAKQANAAEG